MRDSVNDGRLLTAREVSEIVGHTPATVLRWAREGKLPAIRLPSNAIRFRAAQFDEVLDGWTDRPVLSVVPTKEKT